MYDTAREIWTVLRQLENSQMEQKNTCFSDEVMLKYIFAIRMKDHQILLSTKHFCNVINNLGPQVFIKPS